MSTAHDRAPRSVCDTACDAASRSELVVPLLYRERLFGVLDIDSPVPDRFSAADQHGVEAVAAAWCEAALAGGGTI